MINHHKGTDVFTLAWSMSGHTKNKIKMSKSLFYIDIVQDS
uniref:Uncharacterized protein n=1 Tax=Rhizophora mucronata TaxID=61149 RepID=A0A2P2P3A5_RHIMU